MGIVKKYMNKLKSGSNQTSENKIDDALAINKSSNVQPNTFELSPRENESASAEITEELVAVIAAAIAASLGTNSSNIVIHNIRRVSPNALAWATMGRSEQLGSRF
jgi:phenylpyruvate tautomerase PptA (4-oxalocrotonate tautomerase family)